jgi:uncharacterized membrane protein
MKRRPDARYEQADTRESAKTLIWLLCLVAGVRTFLFCAGFPFFNNADEQAHFDVVLKYSQGHLPRGMERFSPESARYFVQYGSPEFFMSPEAFPDGHFPSPAWASSAEGTSAAVSATEQAWSDATNPESWQPPLYYAIAGLWLKFGQLCGFSDGQLLYWLRFLNVFLVAALVWLSFSVAREVFPQQEWPALCVAVLVAFIPQDMFYGIENDNLSPLLFGTVFLCLIRWWRAEVLSPLLAVCLGLAMSATYLTKLSNAPLLGVALCIVMLKLLSAVRSGNLSRTLPALGIFFACAIIPVGAWMIWMQHAFGDAIGSSTHIELSGWTRKPFAELWHHPIFTWQGAWSFLSKLLASFWRGEFVWHGHRLASAVADYFYVMSSLLLIGITALHLPRLARNDKVTAQIVFFALLCFIAAGLFLAFVSIRFDFGDSVYPSRSEPYLWSGRYITGALIPFLIVYVYGLHVALRRMRRTWPLLATVVIIVIAVTVSEIRVNRPVFSSDYNWFHLP